MYNEESDNEKPERVLKSKKRFDMLHKKKENPSGYMTEKDYGKFSHKPHNDSEDNSKSESEPEPEYKHKNGKNENKDVEMQVNDRHEKESFDIIRQETFKIEHHILNRKFVIDDDKLSDENQSRRFEPNNLAEEIEVNQGRTRLGRVPKKTTRVQHSNSEECQSEDDVEEKKFDNVYDQVVSRLLCTFRPKVLPCRHSEKEVITEFIISGLRNKGSSTSLYISGMPGTGKTATTLEVIKKIRNQQDYQFKFVYLNGMQYSNPSVIYSFIYQKITGQKIKPAAAAVLLDAYFKGK